MDPSVPRARIVTVAELGMMAGGGPCMAKLREMTALLRIALAWRRSCAVSLRAFDPESSPCPKPEHPSAKNAAVQTTNCNPLCLMFPFLPGQYQPHQPSRQL